MGSSDYYLFFIHYSFFFEPHVCEAFPVEMAGVRRLFSFHLACAVQYKPNTFIFSLAKNSHPDCFFTLAFDSHLLFFVF